MSSDGLDNGVVGLDFDKCPPAPVLPGNYALVDYRGQYLAHGSWTASDAKLQTQLKMRPSREACTFQVNAQQRCVED